MLFSTTTFILIFLPIVIFIYYGLLRKTKMAKNVFLLLASIIFYQAFGTPGPDPSVPSSSLLTLQTPLLSPP